LWNLVSDCAEHPLLGLQVHPLHLPSCSVPQSMANMAEVVDSLP
jgi:hypothetical protein